MNSPLSVVINKRKCPCCGSKNSKYQRHLRGWRILECVFCGSAFLEISPSPEHISEIYEELYAPGGLFEPLREEVSRIRDDLARG